MHVSIATAKRIALNFIKTPHDPFSPGEPDPTWGQNPPRVSASRRPDCSELTIDFFAE
jgi:hypothetical protein